jgi:stringent starvation protein B
MSVVTDLDINNSGVSFIARFGGVPKDCRFPISAILAIYAKENGRGMAFEQDVDDLDEQEDFENNTNDSSSDDDWYNSINNKQKLSEEEDDDNPPPSGGSSTSGGKRRTGGKGHLKVVK